jgi:hypothetical protein
MASSASGDSTSALDINHPSTSAETEATAKPVHTDTPSPTAKANGMGAANTAASICRNLPVKPVTTLVLTTATRAEAE